MKTEDNEAIGLKVMAWIMYAVIYGLWGIVMIGAIKAILSLLV